MVSCLHNNKVLTNGILLVKYLYHKIISFSKLEHPFIYTPLYFKKFSFILFCPKINSNESPISFYTSSKKISHCSSINFS